MARRSVRLVNLAIRTKTALVTVGKRSLTLSPIARTVIDDHGCAFGGQVPGDGSADAFGCAP